MYGERLLQADAERSVLANAGRKAKRSFAMQSRLQAWRGVFAGREAPHIYLPAARCVLLPADFCQQKNRKKYTLSLKIQHIVCNYKIQKQGGKTVRKKILSIALAVMMAIPTMPVMAASDEDVLGDWYANIYGVGIQITFRKGGSYLISMDGVNNGDPEEGTWKMTGDAITLDEGEENSMNLTVKGNNISADSGEFTLSREETEYDGYTPAKVVDAEEKDFDGIWKADYVSTGNITATIDVFGISGVFISVKSGKLELFLNSDVYEKPLDAEDLTVEFKDNACTFTSEKDEEKDAEKNTASGGNAGEEETGTSVNGTLQMQEDDMVKMTISTGGSDMVFYLEKSDAVEMKAAKRAAEEEAEAENDDEETESETETETEEDTEKETKEEAKETEK